eukprot:2021377-Amphidinium_carterae.1
MRPSSSRLNLTGPKTMVVEEPRSCPSLSSRIARSSSADVVSVSSVSMRFAVITRCCAANSL